MKKTVIALFSSALLAGCGGSDSSGETVENPEVGSGGGGTPEEEYNYGGTPSNPQPISLSDKNFISTDSFDNHFSYELAENEKLYFHAIIPEGITSSQSRNCVSQSGSGSTGVTLDDDLVTCSYFFVSDNASAEVLHSKYEITNSGYFRADIVADNAREPLSSSGKGGTPRSPRFAEVGADNEISDKDFYNYYAIEGSAGDVIDIQLYPDESTSSSLTNNCRATAGTRASDEYINSGAWYGVSFNGEPYSCNLQTNYEMQSDGILFFHVKLVQNDNLKLPASGYFRISVTPAS